MASRMATAALILVGSCLIASASGKGVIDARLQKRFLPGMGGGEGEPQNVMVSFTQSIQSVFEQVNKMNFSSPAEKRSTQSSMQQQFTDGVQKGLKTFLQGQGVQSESFWIANKMMVPNASEGLVQAIASFPGVSKVEEEPVMNVNLPYVGKPWIETELTRNARQSGLSWGVERIRAKQVWDMNIDGWRVVVANIDTGVRRNHESLRDRYRDDGYGWYDPYSPSSATPNDGNGHGTHTMGTIAGSKGVGVAPLATWIACKGCSGNGCGGTELLRCAQWIQCPFRPGGNKDNCDASKAPHIVNNSWGGSGSSNWFDNAIQSWQNSGIIPVFSNGNSGPNCKTSGTPGERKNVISVGSTESNEKISSFSSLGPAADGRLKPDISAPGGNIRSAWHTGDTAYNSISGTSMAAPHVAGMIALMLEKKRTLKYNDIYNIIAQQANRNDVDLSSSRDCGDKPARQWPNNVFGYGRIDALNSVNAS